MACSNCKANPCNCGTVGRPAFIVQPPDGTIQGQFDPPCQVCDLETDDCCNLFDWQSNSGKVFLFSWGNDILVPEPDGETECDPDPLVCCDTLTPQLIHTICLPRGIAPGTYVVWARLTVKPVADPPSLEAFIKAGTTVTLQWAKNCNTPAVDPIEFLRYHKDCCCDAGVQVPQASILGEQVHVNGTLLVSTQLSDQGAAGNQGASCLPAFQLFGVAGCPEAQSPTVRIVNLQIVMFPMGADNRVDCSAGGPLQTLVGPAGGCVPQP